MYERQRGNGRERKKVNKGKTNTKRKCVEQLGRVREI